MDSILLCVENISDILLLTVLLLASSYITAYIIWKKRESKRQHNGRSKIKNKK